MNLVDEMENIHIDVDDKCSETLNYIEDNKYLNFTKLGC